MTEIEILTEIRDLLHVLVEQRRPASSLSRVDRERVARLLPAIAGAFGSVPKLCAELLEHHAVRIVAEGLNARQLGRLLTRAEGRVFGGYIVERVGTESGSGLWSVRQVYEFPMGRNHDVLSPGAGARRD